MNEKKVIRGVRTDLSPAEFHKALEESPRGKKVRKNPGRIRRFLGNMLDDLSSFGLIPPLNTVDKSGGVPRGGVYHGSRYLEPSFRESYRVPTQQAPRQRTHEDYMNERRAAEAYLRMVDGKGDPTPPCNCDHER